MKLNTKDRGFSLIEVLVTLIIVSVGLLGIAALQTTGLRFNAISTQRSIASIEINNFIGKMRANICGVQNTDPAKLADIGPAYSACSTTTTADKLFSYADKTSELPLPVVGTDVPTAHTTITDPGNTCTTSGTPCDSDTQAKADLWAFAQNVATNLVNGAVRVSCNDDLSTATLNDCTNASTYKVMVIWQEADLGAGNTGLATGANITQTFFTVFRP
jgi:type IV pilus modification protein PilV